MLTEGERVSGLALLKYRSSSYLAIRIHDENTFQLKLSID
jgi:hypothetical protein